MKKTTLSVLMAATTGLMYGNLALADIIVNDSVVVNRATFGNEKVTLEVCIGAATPITRLRDGMTIEEVANATKNYSTYDIFLNDATFVARGHQSGFAGYVNPGTAKCHSEKYSSIDDLDKKFIRIFLSEVNVASRAYSIKISSDADAAKSVKWEERLGIGENAPMNAASNSVVDVFVLGR